MNNPACWNWPIPDNIDCSKPRLALITWQDGLGALCGNYQSKLVEDHDHVTGLSRGFLCSYCNILEPRSNDKIFNLYRTKFPAKIIGISYYYKNRRIPVCEYINKVRLEPDVAIEFNKFCDDETRGPTNAINRLLRIALNARDAKNNSKEAS